MEGSFCVQLNGFRFLMVVKVIKRNGRIVQMRFESGKPKILDASFTEIVSFWLACRRRSEIAFFDLSIRSSEKTVDSIQGQREWRPFGTN